MRLVRFLTTNLNEERRPTRNSVPPASEGHPHEGVEHRLSPHRLPRSGENGVCSTYREAGGNAFYRKGFPPVTAIVAPDT